MNCLDKLVGKIPFFKVEPQFLPLSIKFKLPSVSGANYFYNILSITSRKANLHFAEYLNEKDSITLNAFSFILSRYMLFDFLTIKINTLFLILREILFAFKYIFEWQNRHLLFKNVHNYQLTNNKTERKPNSHKSHSRRLSFAKTVIVWYSKDVSLMFKSFFLKGVLILSDINSPISHLWEERPKAVH